ncbi:MAG: hypothetical protein NDI93_00530 [Pseudomonas sp.]|nr:hypothetical protein [Pseudomonas sp.]
MSAPVIDLTIPRGKTFEFAFLCGDEGVPIHKPISALHSKVPLILEVPGHSVPDGWPVQIECVRAPWELNTASRGEDFDLTRLVDADTLSIVGLSGSCWRDYRGGGVLTFPTPMDLTGCHARATVRDRAGGNVLFRWHSSPDAERDGAIEVDAEGCQIVLLLDAATSAALPWRRGVYEVELIDATGRVHAVTAISRINVTKEVTT